MCRVCQAACSSLAEYVARPAGLTHQIYVERRHIDCVLVIKRRRMKLGYVGPSLLCQHTKEVEGLGFTLWKVTSLAEGVERVHSLRNTRFFAYLSMFTLVK
jgi:hypothetical protein